MRNTNVTASALTAKTASGNSGDITIEKQWKKAIIYLEVTALGGSPTTGTLDLNVEFKSPQQGRYIRTQTKAIGKITDADATPTYTAGDHTFGSFTQITQATTLEAIEARGLDDFLSEYMRISWTIAFTGGVSPSWTFSVNILFIE